MTPRLDDGLTEAFRSFHFEDRPRSAMPPGLSLAVVDDGRIATWCAGVRDADRPEPVDARTPFQAGSISKPVAAACVLRLVAEGVLDLDDDVDDHLRSWRLPRGDRQPRVTLRQLLSHTAGLTVTSFPGYPAGQPVPSLPEVLDGAGNTLPVRVTTQPGPQHSYSGGGYCVLQQLLVDVTQLPFDALAYELVLEPVGMADSTYAQPLPAEYAGTAASGHRPGGHPVTGRWHTYPEQAAAGIWSTPTDLAQFLVAIRDSRADRPDALLTKALADEMATAQAQNEPYGLGLQLADDGEPPAFGHAGSSEGFQAYAVLHDTGQGAVVMTNSDTGGEVINEVVLPALAANLGWPTAAAPSTPAPSTPSASGT